MVIFRWPGTCNKRFANINGYVTPAFLTGRGNIFVNFIPKNLDSEYKILDHHKHFDTKITSKFLGPHENFDLNRLFDSSEFFSHKSTVM